MAVIITDTSTNEVIAVIADKGKSIIKDGYEMIVTHADNEPIFHDKDGKVTLNCFDVSNLYLGENEDGKID